MKKLLATVLLLAAGWTSQAQTIPCLSGSLATGVLAFYPFPLGSLNDMSGGGHNLVNPTLAYPTADRFGNPQCAYHFTRATGDYIHFPIPVSTPSFIDNITTNPFSISLWYKPIGPRPIAAYELLMGRGTTASTLTCPDTWGQWSIGLYDCRQAVVGFDKFSTWENAAGGMGCGPFQASVTGNWHHLAFTYDGTTRKLYIDGTLYAVTSTIPCGSMAANIGDLMLGRNFNGDLDDVIIYDHDLTFTEVLGLFQSPACCEAITKNGPCEILTGSLASGVMAFYPFPSGSLTDMSGAGNNLSNPTFAYPTADRFGNPTCAYHFDEVNGDYLHIPIPFSTPSFIDNITTSPFSISLWYQPIGPRGVGDYELLIGRGTTASTVTCPDTWGQWSIGLYDCRQAVVGFDKYSTWENAAGGSCSAFMAAVTGSWHHLAFVFDGTNRNLYIDGTLYSTTGGPCGSMAANLGDLMLGRDFTGDLDDIVIYNRDLTPSEVGDLFHLTESCCDTPVQDTCEAFLGTLGGGVIAYYPFGYGSLLDMSGGAHDLANPTSAYPTMDRSGNPTCAYHFDEVNGDFLMIPASSGGSGFLDNITTNPFSISLWYQPIGPRAIGDYELLMGRGNAASTLHCPDTWGEWSVGLYDCRQAVVGFDQYSTWQNAAAGSCSTFMAAVTGNWHHLAFVYDGTTRKLYVDGMLYSTTGGGCGPMSANLGDLMLGKDFTGDLDDIIIFNRDLSVSEVAHLSQLSGSCCEDKRIAEKATNTPADRKISTLHEQGMGVRIFPNPSDGQVFVSAGNTHIRSISVHSSTGQLAGSYHFDAPEVSFNIDKLAPGIYLIKVVTDSETSIQKVIKR